MVIERFKGGDPSRVGERFRREGRLMPEGVEYVDSWMDRSGARCFQLMEARDRDHLNDWIRRWEDLVDFEVVSVQTSKDFWASATPGGGRTPG